MRFLILFTVHNITHYQGDKGLFSDKKGLILVSGGSKAVFMALNFAGTLGTGGAHCPDKKEGYGAMRHLIFCGNRVH